MNCYRCRLVLLSTLACWAWLFTPSLCRAGSYTYNSGVSQRTVNAGILILSQTTATTPGELSTGAEDNPDPYVFYVLSKRADVLPYGWTVVNPLAPKNVTAAIEERWSSTAIPARLNTGPDYAVADTLNPDMAAYWEVSLPQAAASDLQQFDVLLLDIKGGTVSLTAADAEKLRRFVDGGGTLWIEGGAAGLISATNGLFISSITFQAASAPLTSPATTSLLTTNPTVQGILSAPYFLQTSDLDALAHNGSPADYSFTLSSNINIVSDNAQDTIAPALAFNAGNPSPTIAAAGAYGAGAIVIESTYIARVINGLDPAGNLRDTTKFSGNVEPTGATAAETTSSLKFLANIIAWSGGHSGERHSSHQEGSAFSAFPSPVRLWNYNVSGNTNAPAAAIYGSMAYVVDSLGTLHAFDINPSEDIANPYNFNSADNGISVDYSQGTSYDEVWHASVGPLSSAPVVTVGSGGKTFVLVEKSDGSIAEFPAATGIPVKTITPGVPVGSFTGNAAPAPVVFDGNFYATLPDGSFYSDNLASPTTGPTAYAPTYPAIPTTGAMAVGIIPVDSAVSGLAPPTNDIVDMVPSNEFLYTVLLGSRGEALTLVSTANPTVFRTKLPGQASISTVAPSRAYVLDTNGFIDPTNPGTMSANRFTMTSQPPVGATVVGDYDTDITSPNGVQSADSGISLTRTRVGIASQALMNPGGTGVPASGYISSPAIDRFGNACFVTNDGVRSALMSFHDSVTPANVRLNWRFRLPTLADRMADADKTITDADGRNYNAQDNSNLVGYTFVNEAPVVDERGNVYALATKGTQVAVLCINGLQTVTTGPANGLYLAQPVPALNGTAPAGSLVDEFGQPLMPFSGGQPQPGSSTSGGQYTLDPTPPNATVSPPIIINGFGKESGVGILRSVYPNMSEPQSLSISSSTNAATGQTYTEVKLHTNLAWYTVLPPAITASTGGLTKAGGSLFFIDGRGHLISVIADPTSAGLPIVAKYVDSTPAISSLPSMVTDYGDTGVGAGGATPSVANGALVVNGPKGITGYTNRVTVVADSSRVMELNSSGDATWVTDSTTGSPATSTLALAGITTATSLELNHPSSVTELTANDYLIADTGNNRCVRFSRSGQTIWELSRVNDSIDDPNTNTDGVLKALFNKSAAMLTAGEPDTLNQPTSVQIRTENVQVNNGVQTLQTAANPNITPNYTVVHYLISDSGNYRILEVVDVFDLKGNIVGTPHNLVWISHTHDIQQRNYRYQSAAYFPPNAPPTSIIALVTNQRVSVANAATGTLTPSNQDAPGASIVVLSHDLTQPNLEGLITVAQSKVNVYLTNAVPATFDVDTAVQDTGLTRSNASVYIRNPRYLKAYVPQVTSPNDPYDFLLADDNGVFDITPSGSNLYATWGMTQADYQNYITPLDTAGVPFKRAGQAANLTATPPQPYLPPIPFVPYGIQRTATDQVGNYNVGRYLVTNGYSQGDASSAAGAGFGGEVLELSIGLNGTYYSQVTAAHTLGRPTNTSPLVQPTFAYRVP